MLKIYQKYLITNFLIKFFYICLIFLALTFILNILEEISFVKNLDINIWYPYFLTILNLPITIFEIFPFIFLLATQFLFYELFKKKELDLLKKNGLSNLKIIKILFLSSIIMGIISVGIYYNLASKLKFHYLNLKNQLSNDNKYLAMVTDSGLWIKDEINQNTLIVKSSLIKGNILHKTIINEFDKNFTLIRTIQSEKIDIINNNWKIYDPIVTVENISSKNSSVITLETNFDEEKINSLFSNITTLNLINLFTLKKEYEAIGYSSDEIMLQILKLFTVPLFYGIITILSSIIMFNFSRNRSLLFNIILGVTMSVLIYYMNFIFSSLANNGRLPITISIFFPLFILSFISIIGLINVNEK